MDLDFLLTRDADLVVLGVRLRGVDPDSAAPGTVLAPPGALAELVFPPQHVAEQTVSGSVDASFFALAELSGSTVVAYALEVGSVIELTVPGILAACHTPAGTGTAVELPSGVQFAPSANGGARTAHPSGPLESAAGVVGLWLTRFAPVDPAAELRLTGLNTGAAAGDRFAWSLSADSRTKIVANSAGAPATAKRLELTSLGGSLSAGGDWPGFQWAHRVNLGRDQSVVVQERGVLYPFGLPAILTTITERDPEGGVAGDPTGAAAAAAVAPGQMLALRTVRTLRITQPVRTTTDGAPFSRTFPFSTVEVTSSTVTGLGASEVGYVYVRPTPELSDLTDQRSTLQVECDDLEAQWRADFSINGAVRTQQDLINVGDSDASEAAALGEEAAALGPSLAEMAAVAGQFNQLLAASDAAAQRYADAQAHTPQDPDGESPDLSGLRQAADDAKAALDAIGPYDERAYQEGAARLAAVNARFAQLGPAIAAKTGGPRDAYDVAAAGSEYSAAASTWIEKQPQLAEFSARITELEALASSTEVFSWPTAAGGGRLTFPVRLSRGDQVIETVMPLIFIKDFVLPAAATLPEYASLLDPELPVKLDAAWAGPPDQPASVPVRGQAPGYASHVPVAGALFDVVGAATPMPSDIHVVQALNIVAGSLDDLFSPSLGRAGAAYLPNQWSMLVDLPELQALRGPATSIAAAAGVPDIDTSAVVAFAKDYIANGSGATVLFDTVEQIGVDFTKAADRSGGISALAMKADAISRTLGPVQLAGLTSGDPQQMIGSAATLLGFKLKDLVKIDGLAGAVPVPSIVSELVDGTTPTVTMGWENVELTSFSAFKATERTRLSLKVQSSFDMMTTTGSVTNFSLVFPPSGQELLRLNFDAVKYRQVSTRVGGVLPSVPTDPADLAGGLSGVSAGVLVASPPKVTIEGFTFEFHGALVLLDGLRKAVSLLDKVPGLKVTPKGVAATFSLPVPDVVCGAFNLTNMNFRSVIDVPFGGDPVSVTISFASRQSPFALTVLAFGGGGYIEIYLDAHGPRIEASLEFGGAAGRGLHRREGRSPRVRRRPLSAGRRRCEDLRVPAHRRQPGDPGPDLRLGGAGALPGVRIRRQRALGPGDPGAGDRPDPVVGQDRDR